MALGAAYLEGTEVLGIGRGAAGWEVATSGRAPFAARHLVNCAGGWGAKIAAMAGEAIPLQVKANTMTVTARVPRFLGPVVGHVRKRLSLEADAERHGGDRWRLYGPGGPGNRGVRRAVRQSAAQHAAR